MRNLLYTICIVIVFSSCNNDDVNVFEKSAADRAADAITNLKNELTAPTFGWTMKYTPVSGYGSYYTNLKFNEDGTVRIRTDFGEEDGKFYDDTITYRVDNSLNLELIFENYSFFSYLYELDQANFGGEFEFLYANKTGDDLVFTSKSDIGTPTTILLAPAAESDATTLLGPTLSQRLNEIANDLKKFTSSLKMDYTDKDLSIFFALDPLKRTIQATSASKKSSTANPDIIGFNSPYTIRGDSIVFDNPLTGTFQGYNISIRSIYIGDLTNATIEACGGSLDANGLSGVTSQGDAIIMQTSLEDLNGGSFATATDFYIAPTNNMRFNTEIRDTEISADLPGVLALQLYYNYNNEGFYAMGFVFQKTDGSVYFILRSFTPELIGNKIIFHWDGDPEVYNTDTPEADPANVTKYLDYMSEGESTYVFKLDQDLYEFYNPCSQWSYVMFSGNQ